MRISDRVYAGFMSILGVLVPLSIAGLQMLTTDARYQLPKIFYLIFIIVTCAVFQILAAWLYSRNRPAMGGSEEQVRSVIRAWYRDAKKWMDEHPEHVDMKDL